MREVILSDKETICINKVSGFKLYMFKYVGSWYMLKAFSMSQYKIVSLDSVEDKVLPRGVCNSYRTLEELVKFCMEIAPIYEFNCFDEFITTNYKSGGGYTIHELETAFYAKLPVTINGEETYIIDIKVKYKGVQKDYTFTMHNGSILRLVQDSA